jgi:hypothetical protein
MLKIYDAKENYFAYIPWSKIVYIKLYPADPSILIRIGDVWERVNIPTIEDGEIIRQAWERFTYGQI